MGQHVRAAARIAHQRSAGLLPERVDNSLHTYMSNHPLDRHHYDASQWVVAMYLCTGLYVTRGADCSIKTALSGEEHKGVEQRLGARSPGWVEPGRIGAWSEGQPVTGRRQRGQHSAARRPGVHWQDATLGVRAPAAQRQAESAGAQLTHS